MSISTVPGIIAALAMKPVPPMLARDIANACLRVAADSQRAEPPPAPRGDGTLDHRA